MITVKTRGITEGDGTLTVSIPTHLRDTVFDVVITLDAVEPQSPADYPPGFIEATFGCLPELVRLPQGESDTREPLSC
ncbi:MAG TPA: hypothetical protein VGM51_09750 [Armatimonadota bacterium]|jgi:hypothetical protein